jgi:hypothetical protein
MQPRRGPPAPTPGTGTRAQVQCLVEAVTEAPPAPGAEEEAFFGQPRHILARMVRDVLATGDVAATIKDIMPAIVQARARLRPAGRNQGAPPGAAARRHRTAAVGSRAVTPDTAECRVAGRWSHSRLPLCRADAETGGVHWQAFGQAARLGGHR